MRTVMEANKAELEYQESTIDDIYSDLDFNDNITEEQACKLGEAYCKFRDVLQESIRQAFPEGTTFKNF